MPTQRIGMETPALAESPGAWVSVVLAEAVHPFASVIEIVY